MVGRPAGFGTGFVCDRNELNYTRPFSQKVTTSRVGWRSVAGYRQWWQRWDGRWARSAGLGVPEKCFGHGTRRLCCWLDKKAAEGTMSRLLAAQETGQKN